MGDIIIDMIGGNCPVQIEGRFGKRPFYFRARGSRWSVSVADEGASHGLDGCPWYYEKPYGKGKYDAGWMGRGEALTFLNQALSEFKCGVSGGPNE